MYVSAGVFRGMRFAICCASIGVIPMQRATSLTTLLLLSSAKVAICPTLVSPYLLLDVGDDLVAPVHAEVDVEVRHAHALGVQEALEEQVVRDGIEVGDAHRVGDERPGARAAPRPHRDAALLGVADEVPDDEEVAGEVHLRDDVELGLEALAYASRSTLLPCAASSSKRRSQPLARDVPEVALGVVALGDLKLGSIGSPSLSDSVHRSAISSVARDGLGVRGEELRHLVGRLQVHLARAVVALLRLLERAARS